MPGEPGLARLRFFAAIRPLRGVDFGGCTCQRFVDGQHVYPPDLRARCSYHVAADLQPWNHNIPWNCPTFWDGCNCNEEEDNE